MADLSDLLSDISADLPCGENLEYDNARIALDSSIQGTPENQFTGEKAQPPSWRDVQKEATALLRKSKDLQVILYLIRALIPLEGLSGFRDGLNLLEQSLENYWDFLHPQLDPSDGLDPTLRVNIIEELASMELVLQPLSLAMMVESKSVGRFSLRDIHYASDKIPVPEGGSKPEISTIKAAFLDIDQAELEATYQAINDAIESLGNIESLIAEKVGSSNAPNLEAVKALLKEIRHYFDQMAGSRLSSAEVSGDEEQALAEGEDAAAVVPGAGKAFVSGNITSRRDVINALDSVCKYYREYEPSSPVPIFIERAKYLVTADFMAVVRNILPDAMTQLEILKGPEQNDGSLDY